MNREQQVTRMLPEVKAHIPKLREVLALIDRFEHWTLDLLEKADTLNDARDNIPQSVAENFTAEEMEQMIAWFTGCLLEYPSRIAMLQFHLQRKQQSEARRN